MRNEEARAREEESSDREPDPVRDANEVGRCEGEGGDKLGS
jgi:hypothetical protein